MGKGKEDDLETLWHRDLEAYVKETGYTWRQLERLAEDRIALRSHVGAYALEGAMKAMID